MTSLVLYVGIAVTFLTVWGVIMVGGYLIGREPVEAPTLRRVPPPPPPPSTSVTL